MLSDKSMAYIEAHRNGQTEDTTPEDFTTEVNALRDDIDVYCTEDRDFNTNGREPSHNTGSTLMLAAQIASGRTGSEEQSTGLKQCKLDVKSKFLCGKHGHCYIPAPNARQHGHIPGEHYNLSDSNIASVATKLVSSSFL